MQGKEDRPQVIGFPPTPSLASFEAPTEAPVPVKLESAR